MASPSASSASSLGFQVQGGSVNENSPGVIVVVIVAIVLLFFIFKRRAN